jgi:predicted metal-dependent hydrolase
MKVLLTELARSYFSRTVSAYPDAILPFALQRFMQGRRLALNLSRPHRAEFRCRVALWAFRISDSPRAGAWIPIWYRLPLPSDDVVDLCSECFGQFSLGRHDLFGSASAFLEAVETALPLKEQTSALAELGQRLPPELDFLTEPGTQMFVWRHNSKRIVLGDHIHEYRYCALLQDTGTAGLNQGTPLSALLGKDELKQRLERLLSETVDGVETILAGSEGRASSQGETAVEIPLPPRHTSTAVRRSASGGAEELTDGFIRACRQWGKERGDPEPLDVLFITRCGEPEGAENQSAYARFLLGTEQKADLRKRSEAERHLLPARLLKAAKSYLAQGQSADQLIIHLGTLGMVPVRPDSPSDLGLFSDPARWHAPDEGLLVENLVSVFERNSFPAKSVISNRIMGHGCCEEVYRLYETSALTMTLGAYPLDLLLAETALLPAQSRQCLFYVPLPIPTTVTSGTFERFFLSYAVGMASPLQIAPEALRETLERESGTLYSALLAQGHRLLGSAAELADRIYAALRDSPARAPGLLDELAEHGRKALVDVIRLGDPHLPSVVTTERIGALGMKHPVLTAPEGDLIHGPEARDISKIYRQITEFALSPHRSRNTILARSLINIYHGGLIDDLGDSIGVLASLRAAGRSPEPFILVQLEERLRELQESYRLLSQRVAWIFAAGQSCPSSDLNRLFSRALYSNAKRYAERITGMISYLKAWAPGPVKITKPFSIHDDDVAVYQIIHILTGNMIKNEICGPAEPPHRYDVRGWANFMQDMVPDEEAKLRTLLELTFTPGEGEQGRLGDQLPWGVTAGWIDEGEIRRRYPDRLWPIYQRWRPELRITAGAVLIRTQPLSSPPSDLLRRLDLAGNEASGLGFVFLKYLTRVYCPAPSGPAVENWDIGSAIDVTSDDGGGILVLLPGALAT